MPNGLRHLTIVRDYLERTEGALTSQIQMQRLLTWAGQGIRESIAPQKGLLKILGS
ncbi:hypothetical protein KAU04_06990 [bacterium]|nr:hypothetical protein [bacterium]